jgi:hypothetical protein
MNFKTFGQTARLGGLEMQCVFKFSITKITFSASG